MSDERLWVEDGVRLGVRGIESGLVFVERSLRPVDGSLSAVLAAVQDAGADLQDAMLEADGWGGLMVSGHRRITDEERTAVWRDALEDLERAREDLSRVQRDAERVKAQLGDAG